MYRLLIKGDANNKTGCYFKYMKLYKKKLIILTIISLLVSGLLPYGLIHSNNTVDNNCVSHAELCCCGHAANTCQSCGCSDGTVEPDDKGSYPVTITSCGGTSDDIFTTPNINYFFTQSVFLNYLPVITLADTDTLQIKDVLNRPPYKPPRSQLLTHFT